MEWIITIAAVAIFGGLAAFSGWKSGRPRKDSLNAQWISWPVVTIFAATAAIFALIHAMSLLGVQTGANVTGAYGS
jgi:amino acid transporter